jgi:hypothetical protein
MSSLVLMIEPASQARLLHREEKFAQCGVFSRLLAKWLSSKSHQDSLSSEQPRLNTNLGTPLLLVPIHDGVAWQLKGGLAD